MFNPNPSFLLVQKLKSAPSRPQVFSALTPSVKRALGHFCSGPGLKCIGMQYKP
jgi:hypothetical protein